MDGKRPVDLYGRPALQGNRAVNPIGREHGLGILPGLQDIGMHTGIASIAAAVAAGYVDYDLSRCFSRLGIHNAALHWYDVDTCTVEPRSTRSG